MSTIKTYRKKPVEIQTVVWMGNNLVEVTEFTQSRKVDALHPRWDDYVNAVSENGLTINTLEGKMKASIGDYIIKGVAGEYYPCKPDIFNRTYEEVSNICPKCGEELQTCEECGVTGCPDNCDTGWNNTYYRDEPGIWFCPICRAKLHDEWVKATENGIKVCGSCTMFKDECDDGFGECEFHQESRHCSQYCEDRIPM